MIIGGIAVTTMTHTLAGVCPAPCAHAVQP